jgi:hypothetical protein
VVPLRNALQSAPAEPDASRETTQLAKDGLRASSRLILDAASRPSADPGPDPRKAPETASMAGETEEEGTLRAIEFLARASLPRQDKGEPPGTSTPLTSGLGINGMSKVPFSKGQTVAFKPKVVSGEHSDWILGEVSRVLGEGKSRLYGVIDIEPDYIASRRNF